MKLGIAGAGSIVNGLFQFIHEVEGVELQAIASTPKSIEKVRKMAEEHGIPSYYSCFDELVADKEVDTMYIATPNNLHYEMCKQALLNGKHVICEKPFTSNVEELKELRELAVQKRLFLLEAISTQYLPNVHKMKELLAKVGQVKIVVANYSQYSRRYDAFKEGIIQPAFDVTKSGGALMDLNIYNIHLVTALFGEPKSVRYMANVEKGIDTSGTILLDYESFKAVLIGAKDCKAPIMSTIQGDKGCLKLTSPANVVRGVELLMNDGTSESFDLQGDTHRMKYEFEEFVRMMKEQDYAKAELMMDKSIVAMDVATKARYDAGVIFPADNEQNEEGN